MKTSHRGFKKGQATKLASVESGAGKMMAALKGPRRGPRKDQASPQAYKEAGDAVSRSKVAKYGKYNGEELHDLLFAAKHCPDSAPDLDEITDDRKRNVLLLGWHLLHAFTHFKQANRELIERYIAVRSSDTYRAILKGSERDPVDPLRTALAPLAIQYEADFFAWAGAGIAAAARLQPKLRDRMTVKELRTWLCDHSDIVIPDDKTLRQACTDLGIPLVGRGRPRKKSRRS